MELQNSIKDKWKLNLEEKTIELKQCQEINRVKSCLECLELLNCKIRDSYIHAVYSSMNRGASGGFEF